MKYQILTVSVFAIIATIFVFSHQPHEANAIPINYNVTALAVPFSTYTRAGLDVLVEGGYNGTITSVYQGRTSNQTLNYEFGYHPTLPLSLDTKNNITASASIAATQTIPITFANNNNRVAIVAVSFQHNGDINHNNARMSSIAIGATSFTLILNKTVTCGINACSSEIWELVNPPTGAQTITITPASVTTYHMVAGAYSFYNVRTISAFGVSSSNTGTSITPSVTLTPTFKGSSLILDNVISIQTVSPSANSNTQAWIGKTSAILGMSQYNSAPTISSPNSLTWTTTNVLWASAGIELVPAQNQQNFGYYLANAVNANTQSFSSNGSKVYYISSAANALINHIDVNTGVETHDFTGPNGGITSNIIFITQKHLQSYSTFSGASWLTNSVSGNVSIGSFTMSTISDMKFRNSNGAGMKFSSNSTAGLDTGITTNACELTYIPTNTTTPIDDIGCDKAIPNHANRYWNGMLHYKVGNYYTNSTLNFLNSIDSSTYKKALTIPASVYNIPNPDVKLLGHWNGQDQLISVSSTQINYINMPYLTTLFNENRAFQSYDLTLVSTDSNFYLSPSSISPVIPIKLYGVNAITLNTTVSKYGMITLPSGYYMRTTASSESVIRNVDPRWTNTISNDYPAITTTSSLFPIVLTVSNAPTDASLWLSNPSQIIRNVNSVWCITQLDSTHTAECDIPTDQCANIYVADISVSPVVYIYEGNVCATGSSQKTIAYTQTLPTSFFTLATTATTSYTPSTNGLLVTLRGPSSGYNLNIIIRNQTGAITQNFTANSSGSVFSTTLNVTNATKPATVYISIGGNQIYTTYVGSPFSLANVSTFFHTYFNYQGFDLLSFIPIIFASMFTRNTVGAGMIMTVLVIATLSWLSVVVIPDLYIAIIALIAVVGMIGYRSIWG